MRVKNAFKKPTSCDCSLCKKPDWLTEEEHIREVGKFLGYPKCCTEEFIHNMRINKSVGWQRHIAGRYKEASSGGFIPCQRHAERILNEGKSISRIFRNRIATSRFPRSSPQEFSRYLRKIKRQYVKRTNPGPTKAKAL